jgi:hypothetical protein
MHKIEAQRNAHTEIDIPQCRLVVCQIPIIPHREPTHHLRALIAKTGSSKMTFHQEHVTGCAGVLSLRSQCVHAKAQAAQDENSESVLNHGQRVEFDTKSPQSFSRF